jgi:hypothetical protein
VHDTRPSLEAVLRGEEVSDTFRLRYEIAPQGGCQTLAKRGNAQYAPRRVRMTSGVLKRIVMSSQIDQFSR